MDRAIAIPSILKSMISKMGKSRLIGPPTFHDFHFNLDKTSQDLLTKAADKAGPLMHRMLTQLGLDDVDSHRDPTLTFLSPMSQGQTISRQPLLGVDPTQPPDPSEAFGIVPDLSEHKATADSKTALAVAGAITAATVTGGRRDTLAKGAARWVESMTLVDAGGMYHPLNLSVHFLFDVFCMLLLYSMRECPITIILSSRASC
jgi:hypothetical protein